MKIKLKNIGSIKQAEFELGELTIICGHNNTGKTYATYALFGFLENWQELIKIEIEDNIIENLVDNGSINIELTDYIQKIPEFLKIASTHYSKNLYQIFASSKTYFSKSTFEISLTELPTLNKNKYKKEVGSNNSEFLILLKEKDNTTLTISLLNINKSEQLPYFVIKKIIADSITDIIFSDVFSDVFISSAERTGAAIFANELDFSRNKLLKEIGRDSGNNQDIQRLLHKTSQSDYALPVEKNVEFIRQLKSLFKQQSFIQEKHPEILTEFHQIIGGEYMVDNNNQLHFKPNNSKIKLTMDESSSSVRSLLDIGFYLRHIAEKGDLLIVDEPELNLHPINQRRVARLFAHLINIGIRVFITTHSDYIVKELNTLIMLNDKEDYIKKIMEAEGYQSNELLLAKQVKVYIAKEDPNQTLVATNINDKLGIEMPSFDDTINKMNQIQEAIIWGD